MLSIILPFFTFYAVRPSTMCHGAWHYTFPNHKLCGRNPPLPKIMRANFAPPKDMLLEFTQP